MEHQRFLEIAHRILDGDDSMHAAQELESVVIGKYLEDDRFEELGEILAFYAGGEPSPFSSAQEVRAAIRTTISSLA